MPAPEAQPIMQDIPTIVQPIMQNIPTIVQPDFTYIREHPTKYGIHDIDAFVDDITLKLSGQSITSYQDFLQHVGNLKKIKNDKTVPVFSSTINYESIYKALYPDNNAIDTRIDDIDTRDTRTDEEKKLFVGGKRKRQRKTRKSKKSRKPRKTHRRRM
jgi:hypothetical protein